LQKKHY